MLVTLAALRLSRSPGRGMLGQTGGKDDG
jgi:hypothetical protein